MRLGRGGGPRAALAASSGMGHHDYGNLPRDNSWIERGRPGGADVKEGDLGTSRGLSYSFTGPGPRRLRGRHKASTTVTPSNQHFVVSPTWLAHPPAGGACQELWAAGGPFQEHSRRAQQVIYRANRCAAWRWSEAQMAAAASSHPIRSCSGCAECAHRRNPEWDSADAHSTNFLFRNNCRGRWSRSSPRMRDMHWHPNPTNGILDQAPTCDRFQHRAGGDHGHFTLATSLLKKALGHYVENTGNTDLVYMEVFPSVLGLREVTLSDWFSASVRTTMVWPRRRNLDPSVIKQLPGNRPTRPV